MVTKITSEVLESYLHCKFKGHLKLAGQQGRPCDFEAMLTQLRAEVRLKAIDTIMARHSEDQVARNIPLTTAGLKRGPQYILDGTLEDDALALHFDALKRVEGESKLGDFHYLPMLFHEGRQVKKEQKLLLEVYGILLSGLQGRAPAYGVIWHGRGCKTTRVKLNPDHRKAEQVLRGLKDLAATESPPRLLLNDHCQECEFRERCHQQAVQEDNLSLLRGLKEKEVQAYARKGILTVTQLAHTFRPRRKRKKTRHKDRHSYPLQARALRDKKTYVLGSLQLPDAPARVYLDLEGRPDEGFIYLIGVIVTTGGSEVRSSFWADDREHEAEIFKQLLDIVRPLDDFRVFCYGSYELAFLRRMRKHARNQQFAEKVLKNTVNILSVISAHVHFPVTSNGLKEVGRHLGCSWTGPEASGLQSLVWRTRWEQTLDERLKQQLTTYNLEDCVALKRVTEVLFQVAAHAESGGQPMPKSSEGMPIPDVQDADQLTFPAGWGRITFFHPDFAHINRCSYFDYQRQRVYIRTSKVLRKARSSCGKRVNRKLRASKHIVIEGRSCPHCKSEAIVPIPRSSHEIKDPRRKRAFDLVFTPAGVRRRVIECRTIPYRCQQCGTAFLPERYERLDKHFHGLKSWAMYQHVAQDMSLPKIEAMLMELFGLHVRYAEIHMFKALMARHYHAGYNKLLKKLLTGRVLHVDETEVILRTGKAYVWIFASMEEAIFMYRPTREGAFLKDLLKDFHGVLVSDFYAAYDSIDCPQQKCLIHLIRDMNQELLDNPFDEELQSVTAPFGVLLREVVTTIDQHGLKRGHLKKHDLAVARFFESLAGQSFRSETAEALCQRLLKNRDKLFTFMQYDGVPWNNTNAENAIKRFASYRENTVGMLKEEGLKDYLVLLSLCQTCRYRGISFLKFLLSRECDVDAYGATKRVRRCHESIEVYPRGFIPPHLTTLRKKKRQKSEEAGGHVDQESSSVNLGSQPDT
jgi:predicted RecB family nuclease